MHSFMSTLLSVLLEADGSEDEKNFKCHCCCCGGCRCLLSGSFCAHIRDIGRVDCLIKYSTLVDGIANVKKGTFFLYQTKFWVF